MNVNEIFNRYRKVILIVLFLGVSFLIGFFIYKLFFQASTPTITPIGNPTGTNGQLPTSGTGGQQIVSSTATGLPTNGSTPTTQTSPVAPLGSTATLSTTAQGGLTQTTALSTSPSLGMTLNSDGQDVQYYNKTDGKFYRLDANGNAVPLTDKVFHDVQKIDWAPNGQKAVLEYPDGSKIVYDFQANKQYSLPNHWQDLSFSSDSQKLVLKSLGLDSENHWLAVANADGSQAQALENIGNNDQSVYPLWSPTNQIAAMYTQGVDFNRQEVFFVGLNGENFKSTIIEGRGFQPQWSPTGDQLLYSVYNTATNLNPDLWIVDAAGDNIGTGRQDLNVQTWASKCTFTDSQSLYCAVPDNLEAGSGMLPDLALKTQDSLYKINVQTGTKQLIAVPDGKYNISNLTISKDQKYMYFTDATTKQIYKINLK